MWVTWQGENLNFENNFSVQNIADEDWSGIGCRWVAVPRYNDESCAREAANDRLRLTGIRQSFAASRVVCVFSRCRFDFRAYEFSIAGRTYYVINIKSTLTCYNNIYNEKLLTFFVCVCFCATDLSVRSVFCALSSFFPPGTSASDVAMEDSCSVNDTAQQAEAQRFRKQSKKIGRKLSRRLSLIAKVPNIFNVKFTGAENPDAQQKIVSDVSAVESVEITVIAPDKTQRLVSTII